MSGRIEVFRTSRELRQWREAQASRSRVGFVPTMGALHEGHGVLLDRMREGSDLNVLSIFVNPTQFGPNEDLAKYPRTFESDLELAERRGVDAVYAPTPEELYPVGYSTYVEEGALSQPLCGQFRPGHFRGVTTIVLKLFNLVRPHKAYFGLKDAQQFFVLRKMVQDLDLDVRLEGVPTVRESDGLALSSRNRYLSPEDRALAPMIYAQLKKSELALRTGAEPAKALAEAQEALAKSGFRVQYLDLRALPSFEALGGAKPLAQGESALLAVAAYLGTTRLIDNVILE
jgi:pantoate--beta-alanine ligase